MATNITDNKAKFLTQENKKNGNDAQVGDFRYITNYQKAPTKSLEQFLQEGSFEERAPGT